MGGKGYRSEEKQMLEKSISTTFAVGTTQTRVVLWHRGERKGIQTVLVLWGEWGKRGDFFATCRRRGGFFLPSSALTL